MSTFLNSPSGPPKPFKDLGKLCHDLLKKDFPTVEKFDWKSELTASSDHGTFSGNLKKTSTGGLNSGEVSYKFPSKIGEITTKIDLSKTIKLEYNKKNFPVKGLDLNEEISATIHKDTGFFSSGKLTLGGDYKRDWVNGSFAYNKFFGGTDPANVSASLVVGTPEVALGTQTDVSDSLELNSFDTTLFYSKSDLTATVFWKHKKGSDGKGTSNTIGTNVYLKPASAKKLNLVLGQEFELKLSDSEALSPVISFGGSFTPDKTLSIKTRLLSTGFLGIALTQQLSSSTSVTGGVDVDLKNPTAPNTFSYGLKVVLSLK